MHHGFCCVYDWATARTGRQEMIPYGLNGEGHYPDCEAKLNSDPDCDCVGNMAKQLAIVVEECGRLMAINRQLKKQLNNV